MSAGPWEVVTDRNKVYVRNTDSFVTLEVDRVFMLLRKRQEEAHRIAERLNKTEGDER